MAKKRYIVVDEDNSDGEIVGFIFILWVLSILLDFLIAVFVCFGSAMLISLLLKRTNQSIWNRSNPQRSWVMFWSTILHLSVWSCAALIFKDLVWNSGKFSWIINWSQIRKVEAIRNYFQLLMFCLIPVFSFYLMKVSDYFRDQSKHSLSVAPNVKGMLVISGILFPVSFFYYGLRARKISWLASGLIYLAPLLIFYFIYFKLGGPVREALLPEASYAIVLIWTINLLHTYRIKDEFSSHLIMRRLKNDETSSEGQAEEKKNSNNHSKQIDENDPYKILGVDKSATDQEIHLTYKNLAKQYHPDNVQKLGPEIIKLAEHKMRQINEAYRKISKRSS